ncbi:hypothetical protein P2W50_31155 [Pseudomonas protegens]|uniref:hypothetical protein n=1 Tax=Pseudomonas protegens TaxID=380021 RepID=UPI0023ECB217|nr:hypothetical protein [Pseudomonas protegens]MDF4211111.1 hypothetical protein [Pseudomonas protegens]
MPTEPRYPLALTLAQLNDLITRLDASAAGEADPDAPVFALLDEVREARKQALRQIADEPRAVPVGGQA